MQDESKLYVSMPKQDYDDLMSCKAGLVCMAFQESEPNKYYPILKTGFVFRTPSEVNAEMIAMNKALNESVSELEAKCKIYEAAYINERKTWWMKLFGL